jgi:acyl-[acyl-carrier-protein]-phospholipid O-acyltransferase/long-chain-fatty-acid--[acyl-carrier-protein] ligase
LVSRSAVAATASALWPHASSLSVSLPDARKGERIVLLTTQKDADRGAMQRQAKAGGASELAVPAAVQGVDKVPLLGSGKTDYVAATALAKDIAGAPAQEVPAQDAAAQEIPAQEVA